MTGRHRSRRYYVALGDSLAAGVQPIGDPDDMFRTAQGYPDQLCARLRLVMPDLELVNLACPGESTTSMIEGGICEYGRGNQLDQAVEFLEAHRGEIAFVTLDIGFNDFQGDELSSLPGGFETISTNLPRILGAIRAATEPATPLAGMTIYDPFLAEWLDGAAGRDRADLSVAAAIEPINALLGELYAAAGAGVADVAAAFATLDFSTQATLPDGTAAPLNVARVCEWTWMCAPAPLGPDRHPNSAGYRAIAEAFESVLLPQLEHVAVRKRPPIRPALERRVRLAARRTRR